MGLGGGGGCGSFPGWSKGMIEFWTGFYGGGTTGRNSEWSLPRGISFILKWWGKGEPLKQGFWILKEITNCNIMTEDKMFS